MDATRGDKEIQCRLGNDFKPRSSLVVANILWSVLFLVRVSVQMVSQRGDFRNALIVDDHCFRRIDRILDIHSTPKMDLGVYLDSILGTRPIPS